MVVPAAALLREQVAREITSAGGSALYVQADGPGGLLSHSSKDRRRFGRCVAFLTPAPRASSACSYRADGRALPSGLRYPRRVAFDEARDPDHASVGRAIVNNSTIGGHIGFPGA